MHVAMFKGEIVKFNDAKREREREREKEIQML